MRGAPEDAKVLLSLSADDPEHLVRPCVNRHLGIGHGFVVERYSHAYRHKKIFRGISRANRAPGRPWIQARGTAATTHQDSDSETDGSIFRRD
jgi:hypothetical protein